MRRSYALIRNLIQKQLLKRPMTAWEISQCFYPPLSVTSVYRHLKYLEDLGIVGEGKFKLRTFRKDEEKEKRLWQLTFKKDKEIIV